MSTEPDGLLHGWARDLLEGCGLPEARRLDRVMLVEPGCICFTAKKGVFGRSYARTALLKEGVNGPVVYRIVDGFPLVEAGDVYQGPVTGPGTNTTQE